MKAMSDTVKQTIIQAFNLDGLYVGEHVNQKNVNGLWLDYLWSVTAHHYGYRGCVTLSVIQAQDFQDIDHQNILTPLPNWWKAHLLLYPHAEDTNFVNIDPLRTIELDHDPVFEVLSLMPLVPVGSLVSFGHKRLPSFSLLSLTDKATVQYEYEGVFEYPALEKLWDAIWKLVGTVRKAYADEQIEAQFKKWNLP